MDANPVIQLADFIDRKNEIEKIFNPSSKIILIDIYGEAGIGKTSLLLEAKRQVEKDSSRSKVIYIDLDQVKKMDATFDKEILKLLSIQVQEISGMYTSSEQFAGTLVNFINQLASKVQVLLMFDTTEAFQDNMEFWKWMETYIVGPLVVEGQVRQVFAGRIPVPWRRFEIRKAVELLNLAPLRDYIADLVKNILTKRGKHLSEGEVDRVIDMVFALSKGHPSLSEKLTNAIIDDLPDVSREKYCLEIVKPFIEEYFFSNIEPPWPDLLWWMSPLERFDSTFLQYYLQAVVPDLVIQEKNFFFMQGLSNLSFQHTVVWKEAEGERFHGVIGEIVRECFKIIRPDDYYRARQAAAETYERFANEFFKEEEPSYNYYMELAQQVSTRE